MNPQQKPAVKIALKILGFIVTAFIVVHLLTIVALAFHFFWFSRLVGILDFVLLGLAIVFVVTVVPVILFWSFIVGIIGAGVRLGNSGPSHSSSYPGLRQVAINGLLRN